MLKEAFDNSRAMSSFDIQMVFPRKLRKRQLRVSEQESRFIFAHVLEKNKIHYSVETPTRYMYRQKGAGKRKASTDLTI